MNIVMQKLKFIWLRLGENYGKIIAICAVLSLILSFYAFFLKNKNEETYNPKKPYIKIKSVYFKTIPYQAIDGSKSIALKFFIPIRNEGDTTAYDIEIKKKGLDLVRGYYDLNDPSLQSIYTNSPFDLNSHKTIEDTIFIDESPTNMDQVLNGKKPIALEYEIWFYLNRKSKNEPFVYKYKARISFKEGQFQYDTLYESVHQEIKP